MDGRWWQLHKTPPNTMHHTLNTHTHTQALITLALTFEVTLL